MTQQGAGAKAQAEVALLVCGALAREVLELVRAHGWQVDVYALPAFLHNHPQRIAPAVEEKLQELARRYRKVIVGYGDCGTGGALDAVLARFPNVRRISGPHCYEMYGGPAYEAQAEVRPGTFFLTDFLARGFKGLVWKSLGLDRFPELKELYFGNYTDVVWLAQHPSPEAASRAQEAASLLELPLTVVHTGYGPLEERLRHLIEEWEPEAEPAVEPPAVPQGG